MGNSQSISLLSYGILEEYDTITFRELYPSFANDPYAQSYLNEVDDAINPDDIDEDLLLDDIVSIISRDAVISNHVILKASLIKHFSYGYTNGQIHWPKCFSKFQRKAMPILRTVLSRAEASLRARLLIQPSNLRRRNPLSGVYDMPIGESCIPKCYMYWGTLFGYIGRALL